MIAFLFPGQGVDPPWVAPEVVRDPDVASLVEVASAATGVDVAKLLARGGRELGRVEVLQPALVAVCLGLVRILERRGVRPDVVAGHSLGELAAWSATGAITPEDAVAVAAVRGHLMAREAARFPGSMVSTPDCPPDYPERAASAASRGAGTMGADVGIRIAAYNAPDEWVLSGPVQEISRLRGVTRLAVAGAWHSPAMAGAVDEFTTALAVLPRHPPRIPMIANFDGNLLDDRAAPVLLAGQLTAPIQWVTTMRTLAALGVSRYLAIGPGKTLHSLARRNLGDGVDVEIIDREPFRAVA